MEKTALAPSLLSADFSDLYNALKQIEQNGGSLVHIDVMDGTFVPEISYGQPVVRSLRSKTQLPFDVHLMVEHPETQIASFVAAGADYLTFHLESTVHVHRVVQMIHDAGCKAGIAIVPSTPVSALAEMLDCIDLVLVMTVNPGFGGQKIIPSCVKKITRLRELRAELGLDFKISVDGGVNAKTLDSVITAGADIIVSGSAFFSGSLQGVFNGEKK
ncbi:MAG: ribulose-phosphate 3-epimerase [Treponema sp.]|jgi:ribulose-phosphate 3-epimerase|nr:ribulose-phosphate 3-epimerase [Treponema sp.]